MVCRFGLISTDPATATSWFSGRPAGPVAGFSTPHDAAASLERASAGPSFLIRGSQASQPSAAGPAAWSASLPRLDRINSADLLQRARQIYFAYLSASSPAGEPLGLVLSDAGGRVVFELPVLLPEEQFVPLEWLRSRGPVRGRGSRGASTSPRPGA